MDQQTAAAKRRAQLNPAPCGFNSVRQTAEGKPRKQQKRRQNDQTACDACFGQDFHVIIVGVRPTQICREGLVLRKNRGETSQSCAEPWVISDFHYSFTADRQSVLKRYVGFLNEARDRREALPAARRRDRQNESSGPCSPDQRGNAPLANAAACRALFPSPDDKAKNDHLNGH